MKKTVRRARSAEVDYEQQVGQFRSEIVGLLHVAVARGAVEAVREVRDMLQEALDDAFEDSDGAAGDPAPRVPGTSAGEGRRRRKRKKPKPAAERPNGKARNGDVERKDVGDLDYVRSVGAGDVCGVGGCEFVGKSAQGTAVHRYRKHGVRQPGARKTHGDADLDAEPADEDPPRDERAVAADEPAVSNDVWHQADRDVKPENIADGEPGRCDLGGDAHAGRCDGGVSEWSCKYERTADCRHVARRCQAHGGDAGCKQALGPHHRAHENAGHDRPAWDH